MGAMVPPSRKSCYNFRVVEINRVVDGDTIDVTIDLGFDLFKKERVRIAGVDTPEKRTRDLEEIKSKINSYVNGVSINNSIDFNYSEVVTRLPARWYHCSHNRSP